jgi:hypothetical protein
VAAVGELHRDDELEVAAVLLGVGLVADVGARVTQRAVDPGVLVALADGGRVAGRLDDAVGSDEDRLA